MRKTKIICTIGPASEHEDVLTRMIKAGMDVARLNFSHGSHEEHQGKIDLIKKVRQSQSCLTQRDLSIVSRPLRMAK